jgi:WD40 repeat protein
MDAIARLCHPAALDGAAMSDPLNETEPLSGEKESLEAGSGFTIDFIEREGTVGSIWDRALSAGDDRIPGAPASSGASPFALRQLIGRGGQGDVWEAWQSSLRREVAVKIHRRGSADPFLHEAFVTAELDHPNIVPVFELGTLDSEKSTSGSLAMAMKRVRGERWDALLLRDHEAPGGLGEAALARHLRVFADVCQAVAYAHSRGIAHLDLKPSQVIVGEFGEVYLMDWGMSARLDSSGAKFGRRARDICSPQGTPSYIAPELAFGDGEEIGAATDVYLLGATLHHILSGRPPHAGASADAALANARLNRVDPLPASAPAALRALVEACLKTSPRERPASAIAAREAVERYLGEAESRREAIELHRGAESRAGALDALGYDELAKLEGDVARALALHPGLAGARETLDRALRRHVALAVASGDLELGRLTARQIEGESARSEADAEVESAFAERADRERQRRRARRAAFAALGALACVLGLSSIFLRRAFREADRERLRAEAALAASREQLYRAELRAALGHAEDGDYAEARRALEQAPREFRHWEWGMVASMASPELFQFAPRESRFVDVARSRDGSTLAAVGDGGDARRYDLASGRLLETIAPSAGARFVEVVANGDGFAARDDAGGVSTFGGGAPSVSYPGSTPVVALAAAGPAPPGSFENAATAGTTAFFLARADGSIARAGAGTTEKLPQPGIGGTTALALSSDGGHLAAGGESGAIALYDFEGGQWTIGAARHSLPVAAIAWRPGRAECASIAPAEGLEQPGEDRRLLAWRAGEQSPILDIEPDAAAPIALAYSPDGRRLAVGSATGTVWLFDPDNWRVVHRFHGAMGLPQRLDYSPDGSKLLVASRRDALVFEPATTVHLRSFRLDSRGARDLAATELGVVAAGDDGGLGLWSYQEVAHTSAWNSYHDRLLSIDMAPDASTIIGSRRSGSVVLMDASGGAPRPRGNAWHESETPRIRASADASRFASIQSAGELRRQVWRDGQSAGLWITKLDAPPLDVAIDRAGELFAWSDETGRIVASRFTDREAAPLRSWEDSSDPATALLFSADGATIFAGRRSGAIEALPLDGSPARFFPNGHRGEIVRLNSTADGAWLASASADKSARLWDLSGERLERAFVGSQADTVTAAILSPDGGRLFTACMDGGVRVFDRARGVELLVLREHQFGALDLLLDPQGRWLYSLGREGQLRTWIPLPWPDEANLGLAPDAPPSAFAAARSSWRR